MKNCLKFLERGTGEGLRRSFGPIVWAWKKHFQMSRWRGISYIQYKEGRL